MITINTATDIALAHREIEQSMKLLEEIENQMNRFKTQDTDIRDAFGRRVDGLELGIPSGAGSKRLFTLQWSLAKPVIEAHIAQQKAILIALNEKALIEAKDKT